jgi:hypothetical protein
MDFSRFNLNSPERQALWAEQRPEIERLLRQIADEAFGGQAAIEADQASRFSGLARPNLVLTPTGELGGFLGISVSPRDPEQLRLLVSNGHTASRFDTDPDRLWDTAESALERWLSQPRYKPSLPGVA